MARSKRVLSVVKGVEEDTDIKELTEQEKVLWGFLAEKFVKAQQEAAQAQSVLQQRNADLYQFILAAAEAHGASPDQHAFNQDLLRFEPKAQDPVPTSAE